VDDILLLTKASIEEWKEIERIIQLFCKVSGLRVNMTKSTIHFSGMVESELSDFKHTLPYKFSDLLVGFKYLGYYLKSGIQKKMIGDGSYQNLRKKFISGVIDGSLWGGGIYYVNMYSKPIYWLSLEAIPVSILHKLRILLYNFLWSGNRENKHIHLCKWENLARPKKWGGCGLHNIFTFGKALAASTL